MLSTRRHKYDLNVKLNTVAEAKAVNDNREIAREYGISESWWEKGATGNIFPGELRMTTNCTSIRRALVGYNVTEHLLLSTYANVRLFAFQ